MSNRSYIVMAIKPKYAKAIYEGRKNWEFRKNPPPLMREVLIYESAPVSAITGVVFFYASFTGTAFATYSISKKSPWTKNLPGISYDELSEYAGDRLVTALRVGEFKKFDEPIRPMARGFRPPQNWGRFYIPEEDADEK